MTAIALTVAREAATCPRARAELPAILDAARAELVAAGAPNVAEHIISACLLLANQPTFPCSSLPRWWDPDDSGGGA